MRIPRPRTSPLVALFLSFSFVAQAQQVSLKRESRPLHEGWEFRQKTAPATGNNWRPAQVPGDVHLDLLRNQMIPDPFYRDNEAKLQWIENADWEYRKTFAVSAESIQHRHLELVFEGLDGYCEVYLNDQTLLTADNMFRTWRIDLKGRLKPGANQLHLVFPSPLATAAKIAAGDKWRTKIGIADKTYLRKAAYEYGWDWGPRFVTSGIWKPVRLETWDIARVSDFHIRQPDVTAEVAHLSAELEIAAGETGQATLTVETEPPRSGPLLTQVVELHPGINRVSLPLQISHPSLWYPSGYGEQPLYAFHATIKRGLELLDERTVRTGLRSVILRREPDPWGRSFELVVNGIPIFGKGADVIPFDSFPNRVSKENYRRILVSAKEANMNLLRHWGGGYYESNEFYELCDELGLMIWQDCMFGNDWQPGTYAFKQNVALEIADQIKRLRNHPCIVLWCGNNETEAAFHWINKERPIEPEAQRQMWQDYLTVFSGVIPQVERELTPEIPYWPSSPSADYEETTENYQSGDFHDWSVWHGRVPFSDYEKHSYRFVSEYGFQSFPEMKTLEACSLPEDRTGILTPVMLAHQKNKSGNAIIHDYLLRDYPEPKDFPSFLYVSQVLQAEGIKIGAEHLRRNRPRTMGSIYWQLNDCWPVASWSSIDYFGRWKALQYYARRFYSPILVSPHVENSELAVYIVSDRTGPLSGHLRVRVISLEGALLTDTEETVQIPPLSSKVYVRATLESLTAKAKDLTKVIVSADFTINGSLVSKNSIYLVPTKEVHLPPAPISAEVVEDAQGAHLHLQSKVLARDVYASFGPLEAETEDNYFDLLPGEALDIAIKGSTDIETLRKNLAVHSLVDAFPATR